MAFEKESLSRELSLLQVVNQAIELDGGEADPIEFEAIED